MSSDRNILSKPDPQANVIAQILDTIKKHPRILILALGALTSAGLYLTLRKKQPQIALLPKGSKLTDPYILVKSPLTYNEAVHRSSAISRLDYHLTLNLRPGSSYEGRVVIEFELEKVVEDLFVDYFGKYVQNVTLNEQDITGPKTFANHRIHLPSQHLKTGLNKLCVNFGNDYANDGSGLHSFIDVDQRQYIYSQCAPCYTHRIFPCFDQPDLKAPLKLRLVTPSEWKVISNSVIDHTEEPTEKYFQDHGFGNFGPNLVLTKFRRTPPISTYLYAILAGAYVEIPNASSYKNLKMSLYCRQSVQNYAQKQAQMMFDVTCKGMEYYEQLFETPFAFGKYDLILCPEFNWGAMENVGAVTVSETSYLFKDGMGATEKLNLAYLLLHELAHMWFGNLVTMKWWDDLWLNESFATFIGYYTLEAHPEFREQFPNAWVKFFFYKERGYREDQLSSSHAIAWHVEDTAQSETQFDGITYSKGASVLKQLVYLIGFENFRDAMRHYFHIHKWRNADLADFFNSLKHIVLTRNLNIDLDQWKNDWICTAGLNEINFFLDVEGNNTLVGMTITQSAALKLFPKLREHRLKAGLYYEDGSCRVVELAVVNEAVSEIVLGRLPQPAAVLLNYEDEDFVKARIDKKSLSFFKENLHNIKEVLSRGLVWKCLLDMVKDGKISSLEYIQFFLQQVGHERELILLYSILNSTQTVVNQYIPNELLLETFTSIFKVLFDTIHTREYSLNAALRNTVRSFLPLFADRPEDVITLVKLFDDANTPVGKFNRSHKVQILRLVYVKGLLDKTEREQLFDGVNDNSNSSANEKKRLDILEMSDARTREGVWETFVNPPSNLSSKVLEIMMEGFNNRHSVNKNEGYVKKFFDSLLSVYEKSTYDYFSTFYKALFPKWSENYQEVFDNIEQLLQTVPKKYTPLLKSLSESQEEMEIIRTNKTLCTMNRLEASTNFSWIKSSRVLGMSQTSETLRESLVSEHHVVEQIVLPVQQQTEFKPFHLQETLKTSYTVNSPRQEEATKRSINPALFRSQDQSESSHDLTSSHHDLVTSSILQKENDKEEGKVNDTERNLTSDREEGTETMRTSQSDDTFKGHSLRLGLEERSERSEILEEISILSGERDEDDEEEATRNILRKHWKKQASFSRGESIFKEWVPNTKSRYTEMFKADLTNFSIEKYVPSTSEARTVSENLLQKHYVKLVLVFLHYQSESQRFPEISWTEFCNLCKEGKKVLGSTLTIRDLDKIFIDEARDSPRKAKNSNKEKSICRYEFIEILIRMAIKRYINKKDSKSYTYNEAIDRFIEQDFLPNVKSADYSYEGYRYEKIHIDPMNAVLKANEEILRGLFQKYKKENSNVLYLDDVKEIMQKGSFEVVPAELLKCFALSKMLVIDELNPGTRAHDMLEFVEFVELLVRIAEIMIDADLATHQKFEAIVPKLVAALDE